MPVIVDAFPSGDKVRTLGAGNAKPRIDWAVYADGAIHKLTSADYECDPKNLAGQVARYAKKNGKTATVELNGTDFYVQMTGGAQPENPTLIQALTAPAEGAPAPAQAVPAGVDPFAPQPTA
jgi:hypothetical protein